MAHISTRQLGLAFSLLSLSLVTNKVSKGDGHSAGFFLAAHKCVGFEADRGGRSILTALSTLH